MTNNQPAPQGGLYTEEPPMPIFDPNQALTQDAPARFYQNGHDVTWYILNGLPLPISERFFPVEVR